jgi:hypothetical protein
MNANFIRAASGAILASLAAVAVAATAPASSASGHGAQAHATQPSTAPATSSTQTQPTTTAMRGPSKTGQPGKGCEDLGNQPGRSMSAPGSAFNPDGKAGSVYAGEQPQNSRNTASVSQYDTACARPAR